MDAPIRLTPHGRELLEAQIARGPLRSPEAVIEKALETLAHSEAAQSSPAPLAKSAAEAVAEILAMQKRNRLGGVKIKDLIHERHKF